MADFDNFYRVRLTHPTHNNKTVFRSLSDTRAKRYVETHFPRGSEAYLEHPDGSKFHFEYERTDPKGGDVDQWQPFNQEDWVPPESLNAGAVPANEFADREG